MKSEKRKVKNNVQYSMFNVQYSMFNESKNMRNTTATISRHLLLLQLLLMTGVTGAWGEGVTTKNYYYQQNYESESDASKWKSTNLSSGLSLVTGDGTFGKYIQFQQNYSQAGPRTAYCNFYESSDFYGGDCYIMEFDASLTTSSSSNDTHHTELAIASAGYSLAGNDYFTSRNTTNKNYLFLLKSADGVNKASVTEYYVNGGSTPITIAGDIWIHVKLTVSIAAKKINYVVTNKSSSAVLSNGSYTITDASSLKAKAMVIAFGRAASSSVKIDNVEIYKLGWDVTLYNTSLTAGDNDNKISSGIPTLYNPDNLSVEYSYDGSVLGNLDKTYPPRMRGTGDGMVTATIGTGESAITSSYTYRITESIGGGTYTDNTYTFDKVGLISDHSVDDVPFISMSFRGGPTAVVVVNDGTKLLKVIDANGYSHPNLNNGASTIPPENNWGGTFYKFVPSVDGTLTVTGKMNYAKLYESDGTTLKTSATSGTEISGVNLEGGKTYYLYNAGGDNKGSSTPLLHSFSFIPNVSSLVFRNPQSVITVDVGEGSYTNPAISAQGLPVSYSIVSGSSIANVSADGKVTFTGDYFTNPQPITIKATAGTDAIAYTLNLVKNTWIFNENNKWKTESTDLGSNWDKDQTYSGNGLDGSTFCREKDKYDYSELIKSGSDKLPEMLGLLVSKVASNDRFYIAPKDYANNYIAMRATQLAIDNVQTDQTVTVEWRGGNSTAILDLRDAAGENVTGSKGGTLTLNVSQTGRVQIASNPTVAYINSIKISTPTRAIGTLTYNKTVLSGSESVSLAGFTITDEAGVADMKNAYNSIGNFKSSNTSVVTVDGSGNITAVGVGTAVITATATAKNAVTHQATVTLIALVEVVSDAATRIRTIDIDDLKYAVGASGVNANNGLNRRIPGFDLTFEGGDGVKCNSASSLLLRNGTGKITITPRAKGGETITITQALVTVKSATDTPQWKINGGIAADVSAGGVELTSLTGNSLILESVSGTIEITDIKIYYRCSDPANADNCLDETKVAPALSFATTHIMRVPDDGRAFEQTPTVSGDYFKSFDIRYLFNSSNPSIATINTDGTNGQLLASGSSIITARFNETKYFAEATTSYTIDNKLLNGETYDVSADNDQFVHVMASADSENTDLSLSNTSATKLTFGTTPMRNNTRATSTGTVTLTNNTPNRITIDWIHVVTKNILAWLYYEGQEENYKEQVQFNSFSTGAIAGFRIVDIGDPDNPIDLTDAYTFDGNYSVGNSSVLSGLNAATGETTATTGSSTISRKITKTGHADGYEDEITITTTVKVLDFGSDTPWTWDFQNIITDIDGLLGNGWSHNGDYYYGYFSRYSPIEQGGAVKVGFNGVMLKDEFRWYSGTRALRANLSQPNSSIKFPVKAGMEIDVYVATSSADVSHTISNVNDLNGRPTSSLYIQEEGYNNPVHTYFIAAQDGCVEIKSTDKVGMYLKSITLKVPEIHFTDDIVTVLNTPNSTVENAPVNLPSTALSHLNCTIITATQFDTDGNEDVLDSENYAQVATVNSTTGIVTINSSGNEGWITVKVENNNPSASTVEPRVGTYKLYAVDLKFDPVSETLDLDTNHDKEVTFNRIPSGLNKVVTPVNYSFEIPEGSNAKAMIRQTTSSTPALTTYELTAYNKGDLKVIAQTGRIKTECTLTVNGHTFEKVMDVLTESDIADNDYVYTISLPQDYNTENAGQWSISSSYEGEFYTTPNVITDLTSSDPGKLKISNLYGNSSTERNHGAIRVIATYNNNTPSDTSDDNYTQFVLTLSYPASSGKHWDFYRSTTGLKHQANHDNKIGNYEGTHLNPQTISDYTITGTNSWTTNTTWKKIYRNGDKEPRWAYKSSMKCDNAFVIEETAGLLIETPKESFYVDNNATESYCHIGLHSRSTITVPKLKKGDFVRLNLSRVIPNNGAIISATNVTDLAGKSVDENFTITRSQIDYREDGVLATDANGARVIPGYYTFIVKEDGDVSFTLADQGYLDVLAIEIYDATVNDTYFTNKASNGYQHTMLPVKLNNYPDYSYAPTTILREYDEMLVLNLSYCHPLWSTSVGPAEYVTVGQNSKNMDVVMENVGWYSAGGAYYEDGRITVNEGYGNITVRMNNYTAEGKYLIGYTPDYSLTVGNRPHQDYPFTWNFENISGGAVKSKNNNAYNSISTDYYTWKSMGYDSYQLDTRTSSGSLYVPGATLVTSDRSLGEKGTISELNSSGKGCDEFNGLGFNGQFTIRTALQGSAEPATPAALTNNNSLLTYTMTIANISADADKPTDAVTKEYWTAGDGLVKFGNAGKRAESVITTFGGAHYLMDGGNTKYLLIKPERTLKEGDIITLKGYTPTNVNVSQSGFSFYAAQMDNANDALLTLNWETTDNTVEHTLTHTVKQGDGLAGRDSVYIFRADKKYSVYLTEISITPIDEVTPTIPVRALTCNGDVTVTIPDLSEGHYVYIKSSAEPKTVPSNLTAAVAADGLDAATNVYKYKVNAAGKADVTFAGDTKIYRIGVTNIMKPLTRVGSGDAWATESRDHAIDYTQTGAFTVNDIKANTVTAKEYALSRLTVKMNEKTEAMPAQTGVILKLKLKYTTDDEKSAGIKMTTEEASTATTNAVEDLAKANSSGVPLFYPPYSATILSSSAVGFGGSEGNLMKDNVASQTFTSETEYVDAVNYTRFIFAKHYMQWKKENGELRPTPTSFTESGDLPVFYRLHLYNSSEASALYSTEAELNTLGANKAYMLIRTGNVPKALWDTSISSPARSFVGIAGVSDMGEITGITEHYERPASAKSSAIYDLRGQCMGNDESVLAPGIYIRNGKKFVVR